MKRYKPNKIYIERAAKDSLHTQKILARLSDVPVEEIENRHDLFKKMKSQPDPVGAGKRDLLLAHHPGETFKPFRESEQYLSCDYFTLHAEEGCDLECSYCFLQSHLTNPLLMVYTNIEDMLKNLEKFLSKNPDKFFRIGTGQLADSLSLDHITGFSEVLIPFFAKIKNATLELKTKSDNIDRLLNLNPENNTIVSWSMNSKKIQSEEEHKCATIEERLDAATRLIKSGSYRLGFHIDPIIDYSNWERDYEELVEMISEKIPEEKIAWISMGCFRSFSELKTVMKDRFPKSQIPLGEFIKGMDGKLRYFKPRRIEIYRKISELLRKKYPRLTMYLSMESPEVWQKVFGGEHTSETVCELLDGAVRR